MGSSRARYYDSDSEESTQSARVSALIEKIKQSRYDSKLIYSRVEKRHDGKHTVREAFTPKYKTTVTVNSNSSPDYYSSDHYESRGYHPHKQVILHDEAVADIPSNGGTNHHHDDRFLSGMLTLKRNHHHHRDHGSTMTRESPKYYVPYHRSTPTLAYDRASSAGGSILSTNSKQISRSMSMKSPWQPTHRSNEINYYEDKKKPSLSRTTSMPGKRLSAMIGNWVSKNETRTPKEKEKLIKKRSSWATLFGFGKKKQQKHTQQQYYD